MTPSDTVSTRPMWLKVLYTFDAESKNNCVTRWPNVLEVQSAFVDSQTQIGVVDLKICLQALATSSPELLSQDAVDYTVYAFDYSEEGTPLSGQGLLSAVFDAETKKPAADVSSKVITGRVTKNVLGLFSGNGQETLEVRLRLLPVAKKLPARGVEGQPCQHDFGGSNQPDADFQGWSNDSVSAYASQPSGSGSPVDRTGRENMQRMLHEGSQPRENAANFSAGSLQNPPQSRMGSRPGSPGHPQQLSLSAREPAGHVSRPGSRGSVRGTSQPVSHKRRDSFNSGYYSGDEVQTTEEGPPKKRAKITQIGAPSRSDLNIERQRESLRMVASTASSVRVHRPVAVNPAISTVQGNSTAQEPVRPPTPIPGAKRPGNRKYQTEAGSLRRGSQQLPPSETSCAGHSASQPAELSMTSPEFIRGPSVSSTPANIPSSPPVLTNYGSMPSSPMLPPPPSEQHDSGFMSGFDDMIDGGGFLFDDYLEAGNHNDFQLAQTVEQSAPTETHSQPTPALQGSSNFDEEASKAALAPPPKPSNRPGSSKRPLSRAQTSRPAVRSGVTSPKLAPAPYPRARQLEEEMAAQPSMPPVLASDPVGRRHLQRSNTWAGDMSDAPMSDVPAGEVGRAKSVSKKKVGREQTKARLENALAQNEMPPYCDNCGTIDTPAWRRVFARTLAGPLYDSVELWPESQGAFVWKQVVEEAEDGTIRTFRAYKLSKGPEDKGDDWANVTLCNRKFNGFSERMNTANQIIACGLWFHKNKCMRPQEKWMRNPKDPNQKKKRAYRPKSKRVAAKKGQDEDSKSDAPDPGSEGSSPADGATEAEVEVEDDRQRPTTEVVEPDLPAMQGRAPSAQPTMSGRDPVSAHRPSAGPETRAFQSSPGHSAESQNHLAEVNLTPKPLRRQLFPSPIHKTPATPKGASTQDKIAKPLSELPNFCRRSPRLTKSSDVLNTHLTTPERTNDENRASWSVRNDGLDDLFNDDEDGFQLPPQTPTPNRRSDRLLLKTPSRVPSGRNVKTPDSRTSSSNAHRALQQAAKTPKGDLIMGSNRSVEEMTPCTRVIHEHLVAEAAAKKSAAAAAAAAEEESSTKTPRYPATQQSDLNFPDLACMDDMSPMTRQLASLDRTDFFADMEFPDIFHTDVQGTTTSSPNGFYNFLNPEYLDPGLAGRNRGEVGNLNVPAEWMGKSVAAQGQTGLRRSPRKNKSG